MPGSCKRPRSEVLRAALLDLTEAAAAFARSKLAGPAFSAAIHEHLLGLAAAELDATRRHVTDWEIQRGFET